MKKFLCFLFILISCKIFAWEMVEIVDEFKEPTGKIRAVQYAENTSENTDARIFIDKIKKDKYRISFFTAEYLGEGENVAIKIKIDDNSPMLESGIVWGNQKATFMTLSKKLKEAMKKGKVMKVVIRKYKYNTQDLYLEFKLDGFEEILEKTK